MTKYYIIAGVIISIIFWFINPIILILCIDYLFNLSIKLTIANIFIAGLILSLIRNDLLKISFKSKN